MTDRTKPQLALEEWAVITAKKLVYSVRGWQRHSPGFCMAMSEKWAAIIQRAVATLESKEAAEWREEFPCSVCHAAYPPGTTCLEKREFAIKNDKPHLFAAEYRQRHLSYDRSLFCDNCWSCVLYSRFSRRTASRL